VASRTNKNDEALDAHGRALAIQIKALGPEHLHTTQSQVNYAMQLRIQKRCSEALPILEAARQTRVKLFGADHPDVLRVMHTMADCNIDLGNAAQAVAPLETIIAFHEAKQKPTNDDKVALAMARYGLARALWDGNGSRTRAAALAKDAYASLTAMKDDRASAPATWAKHRHLDLK
jgi:hypothetical protein